MKQRLIKPMIFLAGLILLCSMAYSAINKRKNSSGNTQYIFTAINRGTLERIVSSTGTLNALGTVVIGTQVSGIVDKVLVDYNDVVKKGQTLATLDTSVFESALEKARADVQRFKAENQQAQSEYDRYKKLYKKGHIAEQEFLQYKTRLEITKSSIRAAEAILKRERTNLDYAVIKSPIAGTIIERSVEAGQTIAASLSTPTLFTIAADLSKMQIEVDVDESDIGQILPDQRVRFTVQAYPEKVFYGTVKQVRLNPTIVKNVVSYTVVVSAENVDGLLLPGMTSMVDFIVEKKENVLKVANEAIRFNPTHEMLKQISDPIPYRSQDMEDIEYGRSLRLFYFKLDDTMGCLWAKAGITDDQFTELLPANDQQAPIEEGMLVISGIDTSKKKGDRGFSLLPKSDSKSRKGLF